MAGKVPPQRPPRTPAKADEARARTRERVQASQSERRQKVWDKLDAARRQASEKHERLRRFQPVRGGAGAAVGEDDDEPK